MTALARAHTPARPRYPPAMPDLGYEPESGLSEWALPTDGKPLPWTLSRIAAASMAGVDPLTWWMYLSVVLARR